MIDKELLEFAAKAAGIDGFDHYDGSGAKLIPVGEFDAIEWNPLTDDGDAFRLAVKCLPFHVLQYTSEDYEYRNQDGRAATRRAIVRAAAKIGKEMK